MREGLVEAKIDAMGRVAHITRTSKSTFTAAQWKELLGVLQEWKQNISEVQRVLENVKSQVQTKVREGYVCGEDDEKLIFCLLSLASQNKHSGKPGNKPQATR